MGNYCLDIQYMYFMMYLFLYALKIIILQVNYFLAASCIWCSGFVVESFSQYQGFRATKPVYTKKNNRRTRFLHIGQWCAPQICSGSLPNLALSVPTTRVVDLGKVDPDPQIRPSRIKKKSLTSRFLEIMSDPDPGFEIWPDPDPDLKIWPDPNPGFKKWSDPDPIIKIW